jgi:hypothetical protein
MFALVIRPNLDQDFEERFDGEPKAATITI